MRLSSEATLAIAGMSCATAALAFGGGGDNRLLGLGPVYLLVSLWRNALLGLARIIGIKHAWGLCFLGHGHTGCLADGLRPRSKVLVRTTLTFPLGAGAALALGGGGFGALTFGAGAAGVCWSADLSFLLFLFFLGLSLLLAAGMALGLYSPGT